MSDPNVRSIWPIRTEQGPAIRAIFSGKTDPVVWHMTPDEVVSFALELLQTLRGNLPRVG